MPSMAEAFCMTNRSSAPFAGDRSDAAIVREHRNREGVRTVLCRGKRTMNACVIKGFRERRLCQRSALVARVVHHIADQAHEIHVTAGRVRLWPRMRHVLVAVRTAAIHRQDNSLALEGFSRNLDRRCDD
jgi:hypothetical protein